MLYDSQLEQLILFVLDILYKDGLCANADIIQQYFKTIGIKPLPSLNRISKILVRIMQS
jgi:hypothetical protein